MALTPGLFSHTIATTFADARRDLEGAVVRNAAGKMRAGIFYNNSAPLITARNDMRVDIGDFRAVVDRGGAVFVANVGTAQSPAFTAAPSANKRIDTLIMHQHIPALGDSGTTPVFEIVQGTASPTPVAPTLPANRADAIVLADVEIPAGATSMQSPGVIITPRFPYTAMAGGTVYVRNSVEMAAWTPADGARVRNLSDNGEYVREGGAWKNDSATEGSIAGLANISIAGESFIHKSTPASFPIVDGYVSIIRPTEALVTGSPIAIVGSGFRPTAEVRFNGWAEVGGTEGGCKVSIQTNGHIVLLGAVGVNRRVSFSPSYRCQA